MHELYLLSLMHHFSLQRKDASPGTIENGARSAKSRKTKDNGSTMVPLSTGKRTR